LHRKPVTHPMSASPENEKALGDFAEGHFARDALAS
jgi:hypothetical protein